MSQSPILFTSTQGDPIAVSGDYSLVKVYRIGVVTFCRINLRFPNVQSHVEAHPQLGVHGNGNGNN